MTTHEQQLLESLLDRIANTPTPQRDPQAEALIRERIGTRPDALYILTQTVLITDIALKQANARIQELQQQLQSHGEPQHTSFLGRLLHRNPINQPPLNPSTSRRLPSMLSRSIARLKGMRHRLSQQAGPAFCEARQPRLQA